MENCCSTHNHIILINCFSQVLFFPSYFYCHSFHASDAGEFFCYFSSTTLGYIVTRSFSLFLWLFCIRATARKSLQLLWLFVNIFLRNIKATFFDTVEILSCISQFTYVTLLLVSCDYLSLSSSLRLSSLIVF